MLERERPRRSFIKQVLAVGAASTSLPGRLAADTRQTSSLGRLDHVAIPIENVLDMVSFYRSLGFTVREGAQTVSIHFADQKINFHRPNFI